MDFVYKRRIRALRHAAYHVDDSSEGSEKETGFPQRFSPRWTLDERTAIGVGMLIGLLAVAVLVWGFFGSADSDGTIPDEVFVAANSPGGDSGDAGARDTPSSNEDPPTNRRGAKLHRNQEERGQSLGPSTPIIVHIAGAVERGGIVLLPPQSRVFEAIEKAGGQRSDAAMDAVNLAALVRDGDYLYIPSLSEVSEGVAPPHAPSIAGASKAGNSSAAQCIDLNTADEAQLRQLPGVGPALAQRIINHRNVNGAYTSVNDLDDITGVGMKLVDKVRDSVCQ